jgi:hypothetical protein
MYVFWKDLAEILSYLLLSVSFIGERFFLNFYVPAIIFIATCIICCAILMSAMLIKERNASRS